jgi:NTP pyrophosphatase (non-canonical NTP hydrolase)
MEKKDWSKLENRIELFRANLKQRGHEWSSRLTQEECAELIKAINKLWRFPLNEDVKLNVIEEIADVEIMLEQMRLIFGDESIDEVKVAKTQRLWENMYNK